MTRRAGVGAPAVLRALRTAGVEIATRPGDRLAVAHDASHYLLTPLGRVMPRDAAEVAIVMRTAAANGTPVTFRSGGTSLSGQAGGAGLLVDARRGFRAIEILDEGRRVRTGPGATVRSVNARLARHGRQLGPDPASEIACTIGGVVANNSSGMACGIEQNAYRTLDSSILVLPSGTVVDTSSPDADDRLRAAEPDLHIGLERLRHRIRGDAASVSRLRALHAIKNTMGYGLNAFLDFERPVDILEHLVVGSEGTLAFIAEATFRTVPAHRHAATALLVFPDLAAATGCLPELVVGGPATIELLDAASLRVAARDAATPQELLDLDVLDHAAFLVEYREATADELDARIAQARALFSGLPVSSPPTLSTDPPRRAQLWRIRKGLYTMVAGARPPGSTALLEDIAVPIQNVGATCRELAGLFDRHGYGESVIFGHAKDGNLHFMLTERFDDPASVGRYQGFTEDLVDLVLGQGGTLKAEHGTGRVMAPFVRRQYGDELYDVMREVKSLVDPTGVLNPGVLLSDDPREHLRHLKTAPTVEEEVDRCVECGYCEPVCPSRDLTTTPRERIVLRREIQRAEAAGDARLAAALRAGYAYDGGVACAVDGMCQTACPVLINPGDLVRRLRAESQGGASRAGWKAAAAHWDAASRIGGTALGVADRVPAGLPTIATDLGRAVLGHETVPRYSGDLPAGGRRRRAVSDPHPEAVYFASCTTTMFGPVRGDGVAESFLRLAERAGVGLVTPEDLPTLCCGTPWKSKGLVEGYDVMTAKVVQSLRRATDDGRLPVVCDASSCTEGLGVLLEVASGAGIQVIDAVAFAAERMLPRLPSGNRIARVTLHPTCSSMRLGGNAALAAVAAAIADEVVIPDDWGCCGFAGDRGMLHPELTASATAPEAAAVAASPSDAYASLNRACEMGMTRATGVGYRHILEFLDEAVRGA